MTVTATQTLVSYFTIYRGLAGPARLHRPGRELREVMSSFTGEAMEGKETSSTFPKSRDNGHWKASQGPALI